MTGWLLDTNILSELRKPRPLAQLTSWLAHEPLERLYVSSVTLAEIRFGIESTPGTAKRVELIEWLEQGLRPMFEQRVQPVSEDIMLRWRVLVEAGRKSGHTFSQPDLIIAATALHHGLILVTRDVSDYEPTGAQLFNPWTDKTPPSSPPKGGARFTHPR